MKFLFIFLDGVGIAPDDPQINPFSRANLPNLESLLGGQRLVANNRLPVAEIQRNEPRHSLDHYGNKADLLHLDACLGVNGLPQSATGQATLLTGVNVPAELGYHYGPKPNKEVARFLEHHTLFHTLQGQGKRVALLNAYPPSYFKAIESGRRLLSAVPLAVTKAGIPLKTAEDLFAGRALSADFTGLGWRKQLGITDTPVLEPSAAGKRMATLAFDHDFSFFEFWLSDYAGHNQDMDTAVSLLETLDQVLAGLLAAWDTEEGLILITSDHGNLEDLGTRRHTANPVPAIVLGGADRQKAFSSSLRDLADVAPAILSLFNEGA